MKKFGVVLLGLMVLLAFVAWGNNGNRRNDYYITMAFEAYVEVFYLLSPGIRGHGAINVDFVNTEEFTAFPEKNSIDTGNIIMISDGCNTELLMRLDAMEGIPNSDTIFHIILEGERIVTATMEIGGVKSDMFALGFSHEEIINITRFGSLSPMSIEKFISATVEVEGGRRSINAIIDEEAHWLDSLERAGMDAEYFAGEFSLKNVFMNWTFDLEGNPLSMNLDLIINAYTHGTNEQQRRFFELNFNAFGDDVIIN